MFLSKKTSAMTLAEVLLTLVIIGVVSALTVPGLKKNTQKETTVVQLKKAYNTLNGALDFALAENLTLDVGAIGGETLFKDYMLSGISVSKKCSSNVSGCFPSSVKNLDNFSPSVAVQVADGLAIAVSGNDFVVDVNGLDYPNIEGVDVFVFRLAQLSDSSTTGGDDSETSGDDESESKAEQSSGLTASGWAFVPVGKAENVVDAGWKITYW